MTGRPALDGLLVAAAVVGAVGVLARAAHLPELTRRLRVFLLDWLGEPERPGTPARPSFPSRMGEVEGRLALLQESTHALYAQGERNSAELTRLDTRVSEHRRRNEEQIALLREAVNRIEAEQVALRLARDLAALNAHPYPNREDNPR